MAIGYVHFTLGWEEFDVGLRPFHPGVCASLSDATQLTRMAACILNARIPIGRRNGMQIVGACVMYARWPFWWRNCI